MKIYAMKYSEKEAHIGIDLKIKGKSQPVHLILSNSYL